MLWNIECLLKEKKIFPLYWHKAMEKRNNSLKNYKTDVVTFMVLKHKKMGVCVDFAHGVRMREIASS